LQNSRFNIRINDLKFTFLTLNYQLPRCITASIISDLKNEVKILAGFCYIIVISENRIINQAVYYLKFRCMNPDIDLIFFLCLIVLECQINSYDTKVRHIFVYSKLKIVINNGLGFSGKR